MSSEQLTNLQGETKMKTATAELIIDLINSAITQLINLAEVESTESVLLLTEASATVRALVEYEQKIELIDEATLELIIGEE